jgi:RecA-family ATPase
MALDMLAALAQGQDWACFEPTEEPCRVCVMQWEIPWPYYRERTQRLHGRAREPELLEQNFTTWTPLHRPATFVGNKQTEDAVLAHLVDDATQVLLVDPIRRAGRGLDMNSEQDVSKILGFFERLNDNGITVVTLHHDNKEHSRRGGGDSNAMTGSGAFAGDPDTIVDVVLPDGEDARTCNKRNLFFTLRNGPAPMPRGMEITDDAVLVYSPEAFGGYNDDDVPAI